MDNISLKIEYYCTYLRGCVYLYKVLITSLLCNYFKIINLSNF